MPMSPLDRKVALLRREKTVTEIANELGVTISHVSQVINGKRRSPRVEHAVAELIGKPVTQVFPSQAA